MQKGLAFIALGVGLIGVFIVGPGIPAMVRSWRAKETIPASQAPAHSCPRRPTWFGSES
jgi:hypothetical protein